MRLSPKIFFYLYLLFVGTVFGFLIGNFFGGVEDQILKDLAPLIESYKEIKEESFFFSPELREKLIQGGISGMIESLGDEYGEYLSPKEAEEFKESLSGEYEGIGAEVGIREGTLTIITPLENSPAKKAGLLPGDKIIEINGKSTKNLTLSECVMKIRGKAGTFVVLTIKRKDKTFKVKIKRARIKIPSFSYKKIENIPVVSFYHFFENTPKEFKEKVPDILLSSEKKMILDLRNNPGGYLESVKEIANFFIPKGKVILIEKGKSSKKEILSEGPGVFKDWKIAILINKGSASASEILAGTIKYHNKKATILGEKSFGKGTVQRMVSLSDGSCLKLTVSQWLLPDGRSIDKKGIDPDFKTKNPLKEALKILKK